MTPCKYGPCYDPYTPYGPYLGKWTRPDSLRILFGVARLNGTDGFSCLGNDRDTEQYIRSMASCHISLGPFRATLFKPIAPTLKNKQSTK